MERRFMPGTLMVLAAAICGLAVMASAASAIAPASTWSGASTTSSNWTDTGNWNSAPASGNALFFPNLGSCASPATCYTSNNDETAGFSINGITIDDGNPYDITGNQITLGAAGLTANATTTSSPGNVVTLGLPIALGANQTWTIDGGTSSGGQGINLTGQLSGSPSTLGITLSNSGILSSFSQDQEVGNVTIGGSDGTQTGVNAANNGVVALTGGDLNGTDTHTIALNNAGLVEAGSVVIGGLTSTGGNLQIGNGNSGNLGILTAAGNVTLNSNTATEFTIGGGTTPGTDYGQLNAGTHNVSLDGDLELLFFHHGPCPTLNVGEVKTLITTTGAISGTFAGVPDGQIVSTPGFGVCGKTQFRINYNTGGSPETVTATVVDNTPHATSSPTISGNLNVGQTLTENHASWSSNGGSAPSSYSYLWQRCDTSGNNCFPVGTDSQTYTLQGGDQGHTITVRERASNNVGPAAQGVTSVPTGVVQAAAPPVNQTAPAISGSQIVWHTDMASTGTWTGGTPMTFAYQWQRCSATCSNISGANGSSYTVHKPDLNMKLRVVVGATNSAGGPVLAVSSQVGPVTASPAEIRGVLLSQLVPHGKADSIRAILNKGAVISLTALEPGSETVKWYFLPPGAHIAGRHPKPVLIASGRITFNHAGTANLRLKLTRAGRRMLRHARRMKLTAKGTFTPSGQGGVSVKRTIKLKR